jgi:nucleoside-diphosphate-sugar epimerase
MPPLPAPKLRGFDLGADEAISAGWNLAGQLGWPEHSLRSASPKQHAPASICIGGAAGFLGAWTLAECDARGLRTFAMCRSPERLAARLSQLGLDPDIARRATLIGGAIESLSESDFPEADAYIHCAGRTHGLARLDALWRDNAACAAWASGAYARRGARVVHASTLSCFVSSNLHGRHEPHPCLPDPSHRLLGGYAQSKLAAEAATLRMGAANARLGLLTGSTRHGRFPEGTFFEAFCKGLAALGCAPEDFQEAMVDATPVDLAAKALVDIAASAEPPQPISHVANPEPMRLSSIVQALRLPRVPSSDFLAKLHGAPPLFSQLARMAFFKHETSSARPERSNLDLFQATGHDFASTLSVGMSNSELLALYLNSMGLQALA